jgi:non-ribosomal peptide synthetase component F
MSAPLLDRVLGHAASRPDQAAIVAPDRTLSWGALFAEVEALSEQLRSTIAGAPEPLVAVTSRRRADYVVHALAVLRAGGAFVPVDLDAPAERNGGLAAGADLRFGVGPEFDVLLEPGSGAAGDAGGDPLAYGLFTSGTTGKPHLVGVPQSAVLAMLEAFEAVAPAGDGLVVSSSVCPFGFDVSVWELFTALASGGTAVLLEEADARAPARLLDRWLQYGVTMNRPGFARG